MNEMSLSSPFSTAAPSSPVSPFPHAAANTAIAAAAATRLSHGPRTMTSWVETGRPAA
jgi:hypothetical protein